MTDRIDDTSETPRQVVIGGIAAALTVPALRALLDPATRDQALIEVDLTGLSVSLPAAALHEVLTRFLPGGEVQLGDDGVTVRPGDGNPGIRVRVPAAGVRLRIGTDGARLDPA